MAYTIVKEIGHGGMGCVYKATDENGKVVAIKMMSNKVTCYPEYRDLFKSEVETLSRMDHPSVVHIVGSPYTDSAGNFYLPMEFVEGETLEQHVRTNGPYPYEEAEEIMGKVLEAMQYVHNRKRIHRDIKPSNIMLRPDGSICIIDFGIAKDIKIGMSGQTVGKIIGTDGYMSPEQANGLNIDHRTDIYSLGCVFFFLLTGKHAVQKENNDFETIANILNAKMPMPSQYVSNIPTSVDKLYLKAVDKNMMTRFQTALEFKEALDLSGGHDIPRITVGKSKDNDICINNEYVSRHHLIVKGLENPTTGGGKQYSIEITDNSTNGTAVDGRYLKNGSVTFEYNGTLNLPDVLLAARDECRLNWSEVIALLKRRGWTPVATTPPRYEPVTPPPGPVTPPPATPSTNDDTLGAGLGILCLIPIVGWVLWGVWRDEKPKAATAAAICAWIGLVITILSIVLFSQV